MIKVMLADDHLLLREGIKRVLKSEGDIEVIAETGDPFSVINLIQKSNPDIILLDLNFPGKSGMDILKEIKAMKLDVKVLVLSMYPEERFAVRSIKDGASGYLTKETASDVLITAIRKIYAGGKFISSQLAEILVNDLTAANGKQRHELLSDRELQVFMGISSGKSQTEIGAELNLSASTVNTYRTRVLEKLGLKTNAEIIYYAIQNKLVD